MDLIITNSKISEIEKLKTKEIVVTILIYKTQKSFLKNLL